jgi:hypothetical protein
MRLTLLMFFLSAHLLACKTTDSKLDSQSLPKISASYEKFSKDITEGRWPEPLILNTEIQASDSETTLPESSSLRRLEDYKALLIPSQSLKATTAIELQSVATCLDEHTIIKIAAKGQLLGYIMSTDAASCESLFRKAYADGGTQHDVEISLPLSLELQAVYACKSDVSEFDRKEYLALDVNLFKDNNDFKRIEAECLDHNHQEFPSRSLHSSSSRVLALKAPSVETITFKMTSRASSTNAPCERRSTDQGFAFSDCQFYGWEKLISSRGEKETLKTE